MVSRVVLCTLIASLYLSANGQEDTVYLEEISITGEPFQRFSTGSAYREVSLAASATLEEALTGENSVYFKTYGNHQLSSISFRGTSASQTNVLWHGVPANYPTLGQMDFSQWPGWLMQSIALQPGSGGALYGSGAIGGTVLIDTSPDFDASDLAEAELGAGSFGYHFTGAKTGYQTGQLAGATRAFRSFIKNDFPYTYNGQGVTQQNASSLNFGFQQQACYRPKPGQLVFLDAQYTQNDREVQPTKASPGLRDELKTENIRVATGYSRETASDSFTSTLAFLRNDQLYNQHDRNISNQYSGVIAYWKEVNQWLAIRAGGNANLYTASSENFPRRFTDLQVAIFGSLDFKISDWWQVTANLRQSFYQDNAPFTPSIGQSIAIVSGHKHTVGFNSQLAWGFRYPTLNDLHWSPGGNPDLKPEESLGLEAGFNWDVKGSQLHSSLELTGFRTWSDNWIIWLPQGTGIWSPLNFRKVEIAGLEASWKVKKALWSQMDELKVGYSYTTSTNLSGATAGNQLPYTPFHLAHVGIRSAFSRSWSLSLTQNFTGKRFTTLDNTESQSVAGFGLLDFRLGKTVQWRGFSMELGGGVNNVLDASYENLINRAMPGRNYQISLSIKYN